jgi:hypothetical protein
MMSLLAATVSFPTSAFPPLAVGFFGLGTGYLVYGPAELLGFPPRSPRVDLSIGIWGVWMPGLMQLITGTYLFVGMAWFNSFRDPLLYTAALAFTAYGVHWFAIGMVRVFRGDARPSAGMCIAYLLISILGIVVFYKGGDQPVGGLFIGLTCIYVADFFASLLPAPPAPTAGAGTATAGGTAGAAGSTPRRHPLGTLGERGLGFFHLGTGFWLMYLTWATALNFSNGFNLPL